MFVGIMDQKFHLNGKTGKVAKHWGGTPPPSPLPPATALMYKSIATAISGYDILMDEGGEVIKVRWPNLVII
jgi:hypothetical protein